MQPRWFTSSSATTTSVAGYSVHGIVMTSPTLNPTLIAKNNFTCTYSAWSFPIAINTNNILCTSSISVSRPSILWTYMGGHLCQSSTDGKKGTFAFISVDGDAVGPLANYAQYRATFNSAPCSQWDGMNTGRIVAIGAGTHTVAGSFFAPNTGITSPQFNGGGMHGLAFPLDPNLPFGSQLFQCTVAGAVPISATTVPMIVCNVTINLPYRAAVWAQFSSSSTLPSAGQWLLGSVDFDGDTITSLTNNLSDSTELAIGPAYTAINSFSVPFGNGRAAILNAGAHVISVVAKASVASGAVLTNVGMDGFFVPN